MEDELLGVNRRTAGAQLPGTALLPSPRHPLEAEPRAAAPPVRTHPPLGRLRPQRRSARWPPPHAAGRHTATGSQHRAPREAETSDCQPAPEDPRGPYVKDSGHPASTRCEDTLSPPPRSSAEPPSSTPPPATTPPAAAAPQLPAAALPLRFSPAGKVAKVRGATRWNRGRAPPPYA